MDKLEKAIKGLETCLSTDDGDYKCERCPYKNTDLICIKENKCDALELLKEKQGQNNKLDYLFSKIAGHSDYHGDSILIAITLIKEGKEIESVRPKDCDGK